MRSWQCVIVGFVLIVSALCRPQQYYRNVDNEAERSAYIRQLEQAVEGAARAGAMSQALLLEDRLEDSILQHAQESLARSNGDPVRVARDLVEIQQELRRDKRAVEFLSGLLGSSSGGGGGDSSSGGGGSGSGSILNLVTPLLGSSSGSSSGGGGGGDGQSAGGSDSGSILNLVGPLLGSSSGGGGGGEGGDAGSGSASILNLVGPLLGSSSGGGSGGDGNSGGGSDLSSILGISNSSGGSGGDGGSGAGLGGVVNELKVGFLQDKVQLLLRVKFGIITKILNTLSGALAAASSSKHVPIDELKYPDP